MVKNLPSRRCKRGRRPKRRTSIPGLGRSPEGRHGNPLQYPCLESPMDRGPWWAIVPRAANSQTCLKQLSVHVCLWDYPGRNTGMSCCALLQGIFPTQGLHLHLLGLLHWQEFFLLLAPPGNLSTHTLMRTHKHTHIHTYTF